MNEYLAKYDAATRKVLETAQRIDSVMLDKFDAEYTLYDISYVLRNKFKDAAFRKKYVGNMPFMGFVPYPKGFCALSTICIYNLYGGDTVWQPSAIKLGAWEHAPVVFCAIVNWIFRLIPLGISLRRCACRMNWERRLIAVWVI